MKECILKFGGAAIFLAIFLSLVPYVEIGTLKIIAWVMFAALILLLGSRVGEIVGKDDDRQ